MLYACDAAWWKLRNGVPEFAGLKVSQDKRACDEFGLARFRMRTESAKILAHDAGLISSGSPKGGGNSGFQAINLAVQFGATRIILVGFDMRGGHWHGKHPRGLNNPSPDNFKAWVAALDGAALTFAALGVEVLNASRESALAAYPVVDLETLMMEKAA